MSAPPDPPSEAILAPGTRLAEHLRVEQRIGAGAHGVVYRVHDEQLGRSIAVKLQNDATTERALERLEHQARAMARLSHPNICIVHGAGVHDGHAFVMMELVDGGNAREWLRAESRDWREIVALYGQAARGLAAAHAIGLVHGDFKPDNLLVGRESSTSWRARVTDFGLVSSSPNTTLDTSAATPTPATDSRTHAAPELDDGAPPTPASDQYSLCASLHESLATIAAPPWVARIIRRGLARDPEQRWPSLSILADRIDAGLSGRSRRITIAATIVTGIAIGGGIAAATSLREPPCDDAAARIAPIWNDQRREAIAAPLEDRVRERWDRGAERATQWARAWIDARNASCRAARIEATTTAATLERSMLCFDRRAAELDATLGMLDTGGNEAANRAVELIDALRSPSSCNDERLLLGDVEPPADAATRDAVERVRARIRRIDGLLALERIADAGTASEGLEADAVAVGYPPLVGECLLVLGEIALQDDRAKEAIDLLGRAHLEARQIGDPSTATEAALLLARLEMTHGDRAMSHDWLEVARVELDRGVVEPRLGVQLLRIEGFIARRESKYDAALDHYRRALELAIELDGDHMLAVAVRNDIGSTLGSAGRGPEADAAYHETLAAYERELGPNSPQTAMTHASYGLTLLAFGRPKEAVEVERLALTLATELYGADSPRLFDTTIYLANALATAGDPIEARRQAERALQLAEASGVAGSTDVALALEVLGWCAFVGKDLEATIAYSRRADPLLRAHVGTASVEVAQNLVLSAHASYELGRITEARDSLARSMVVWKEGGLEAHSQASDAWTLQSRVQLALGDYEPAKESARRVLAIAEGGTVAPALVGAARCCLAAAMIQTKDDPPAARELARIGAEELRKAGVKDTANDCDRWAAGESPRAAGDR